MNQISLFCSFLEVALYVHNEHNISTSIQIDKNVSIEFFNGFNNSIEFLFNIEKEDNVIDLFYRLMDDGNYFDQVLKVVQPSKDTIQNLVVDYCLPKVEDSPSNIWLVSYQYEAFPWDQWNIIEATNLTEELNKPFSKSAGGITVVDYVYIKNDSKHEALIEGGKILLDYIKQFNYPQFT